MVNSDRNQCGRNETSYKYDENNEIIKVTRPDGSILTKTYDEKGRLTSAKDTAKDGTVISSYTYEYSYDILYRLTERKTVLTETGEVAEKENFTYDSACNIIESGSLEGTSERNYNANNQLLSMDDNGFVYDKDGNMTSGVIGGDDALLTYDSQNRLVKMSKDGITYSYTYDAEGIRTSKVTEGKDGKKTSKYTYNLVSDLTELIYEET
ncbi:MAG: RHS repeat protein, partial [Lachnospiraceae bacterium]|nr:RHS repeat protein [Lachnospiraceae bacterium]